MRYAITVPDVGQAERETRSAVIRALSTLCTYSGTVEFDGDTVRVTFDALTDTYEPAERLKQVTANVTNAGHYVPVAFA